MKLLKQLSLSTYIRYFLSYLIIFVLFAIGFFCIIRNQLTENYYNQKSEQIKSQLDSFAKQIDNDITFLYQIDSSIKSNAELIMNRYKSPHVFRHKIFKELTQYETSNKLIDSIIYMSKGMHEVISTDILVEYKNEMFYLINSTGQSIAFDPDDYYNTSSGQIFFLTNERLQYLIYFPAISTNSTSVFFYILDTDELIQQQKNLISEEIPAMALVDSTGQFVAGVNTNLLFPYMNSISLENGIYNQDATTSICVHTNVADNFSFILLLSNNFILNQINITLKESYVTLFLLCTAGFILIFVMMRVTYFPLRQLAHKIVPNMDPWQNYLNILDNAFLQTQEYNHQLQEKINSYRVSMQKSLFDSMLINQCQAKTEILPNIDQLFNEKEVKEIFVVKVTCPHEKVFSEQVLQHFTNKLPGIDPCILLEVQDNSIIFLINFLGQETHKKFVLKELAYNLYKKTGYYCAISDSSSSPLDIPSLYASIIYGEEPCPTVPVAEYNTILDQFQHAITYPLSELNLLSISLAENDFRKAKDFIDTCFEKLHMHAGLQNNLFTFFERCILIDILTIIAKSMNMKSIDFQGYSDLYFQILYLCRSYPFKENEQSIRSYMEKLLNLYEQKISNKLLNAAPIIQIMEEYYCQPDFSIQMLADKLQANTTYISTKFKKELNINFSDYLWLLRLNKAKELLICTDMPITDISIAVGYANVTSFHRKFKQATGLTPNQFRTNAEK